MDTPAPVMLPIETVGALRLALAELPEHLPIWLEGCDCNGKLHGLVLEEAAGPFPAHILLCRDDTGH